MVGRSPRASSHISCNAGCSWINAGVGLNSATILWFEQSVAGHPIREGMNVSSGFLELTPRQALDAFQQVTGQAGDYQIEGARRIATLNIGGSGTTSVALVIGV